MIQGTSSDITKLAGVKFFQWIMENDYFNIVKIPNIIHDEYVTETPETMAPLVATNLQKSMEDAGAVFCHTIPLKAEAEITMTWKH